MADKIVEDEIGTLEVPTVLMETTTPGKDPYIQPINPTSATTGTLPHKTTGQPSIPVYSSYSDKLTTTDQFPMQHATSQFQPSTVPLTTTDYVADEPYDTDTVSKASSSQKPSSGDSVLTSSTSSSVASTSSDIPTISASKTDKTDSDSSIQSSISSSSASVSLSSASAESASAALTSSTSPSTTDFIDFVPGTDSKQSSTTQKVLITSPSSIDPHVTTKPQLSSSSDYVPSTGDVVAPVTASRTTIGSSAIALDTVSVKSTSAVPLTPPPSNVKPVTPESQGTSILGGGLSDYIVYVGAPLCGLAILILLTVCILCLRKRKAKAKGSPAKTQVQDLWVNSQAEIPLCNRSPLLEPRVDDRHIAEKDLAEKSSNLRRRKPAKAAVDDPVAETVGKTHESNESHETSKQDGDALKEKLKDPDTDKGLTTYEAVFDFPGEQDTHLSLQQGDIVKVTRKEDNGWWRGTINNRIGWFPSNYVQAASQDKVETENEVEMHNDSHLSSFLTKKSYEPSPRNSYPTEEEIEAEPIYCKIQPKEKRKSTPKIPDKVTPPQQLVNRENTPIPIEDDSRFKVTYAYKGRSHGELDLNVGDIILGKEQDRNGWMNGCNETTGEEGWFPAVYVEKCTEDKPPTPPDNEVDQNDVSLDPDPASYHHLEANTRPESTADLVGIVHRAVHTFVAEKAGDLEFQEGDLITVFQVLENGWWLGSKDKTVGWFPGSYVQMIDQPSPVAKTTPSPSPVNQEPDTPDSNNGDATPKKSRLRPVRKAPPPPKVDTPPAKVDTPPESKIPSMISKIPKKAIPVRTSPSVPTESGNRGSGTEPEVTTDNSNNNDMKSDFKPEPLKPLHDGLYDLLDHPEEVGNSGSKSGPQDPGKPQIPKRYIKPKLVTVPRSQVKLPQDSELHGDSVHSENRRSRPPPPRPNPPRIGSLSVKLEAPRSPGHMSQSEDEETGFFHLNNQGRVNDILRQDSSEPEIETTPYKGMSSFGSSFGSTFGRVEDKSKPALSSFNVSPVRPVVPPIEQKSHFGAPMNTNNSSELGGDTQTLSDTSPVVFNEDKGRLQNDQFMVNSNDIYPNGDDFRGKDHYESVKPVDNKQPENAMRNENISVPVAGPETAEIAVTPLSPKKKDKPSRLAPPKPVSLALENTTEQKESLKPQPQSVDSSGSSTSSPATSKLPKAQVSGEPVSKLPVLGKKETPVRAEESRLQKPTIHSEHSVLSTNNVPVPKDVPVALSDTSVNDKSASPQINNSDENSVNNDNSFEDSSRPRTDSFDRPHVAPKPKPKGLPKLLPKPKAGLKASPREDDMETEYNDKGNSSDSSLPTTPVKKVHPDSSLPTTPVKKVLPETVEKDDSAKEDEVKPCKIPLGSKIAQKSPQQRGRKSGIPASPGMRNLSKDRKEVVPSVGKGSDTDEAAGNARKVSESDSDAPMSPVSNIRKKPESPAGARRLKKGEGVLRNRSNSPHERKAIPVSLKQRSNSPASKLPRSGIPKAGTSSPANTPSPSGPTSGLVQPKPVVLDQVIQSPKAGLNSRVDTTPSPDSFHEGQENLSPKPDRPSKPPQVQKQKTQDGKAKQGKSLLPVIHKNMEATSGGQNGVAPSPGSKPKRGIPVAKPPRPPAPKSPSETPDKNEINKRTLYQAVRAYNAQTEEELSFSEGTFVKELSDCDRPGWYVGMLADGTTGLYPANHFKPSPVSPQSEA